MAAFNSILHNVIRKNHLIVWGGNTGLLKSAAFQKHHTLLTWMLLTTFSGAVRLPINLQCMVPIILSIKKPLIVICLLSLLKNLHTNKKYDAAISSPSFSGRLLSGTDLRGCLWKDCSTANSTPELAVSVSVVVLALVVIFFCFFWSKCQVPHER